MMPQREFLREKVQLPEARNELRTLGRKSKCHSAKVCPKSVFSDESYGSAQRIIVIHGVSLLRILNIPLTQSVSPSRKNLSGEFLMSCDLIGILYQSQPNPGSELRPNGQYKLVNSFEYSCVGIISSSHSVCAPQESPCAQEAQGQGEVCQARRLAQPAAVAAPRHPRPVRSRVCLQEGGAARQEAQNFRRARPTPFSSRRCILCAPETRYDDDDAEVHFLAGISNFFSSFQAPGPLAVRPPTMRADLVPAVVLPVLTTKQLDAARRRIPQPLPVQKQQQPQQHRQQELQQPQPQSQVRSCFRDAGV